MLCNKYLITAIACVFLSSCVRIRVIESPDSAVKQDTSEYKSIEDILNSYEIVSAESVEARIKERGFYLECKDYNYLVELNNAQRFGKVMSLCYNKFNPSIFPYNYINCLQYFADKFLESRKICNFKTGKKHEQ